MYYGSTGWVDLQRCPYCEGCAGAREASFSTFSRWSRCSSTNSASEVLSPSNDQKYNVYTLLSDDISIGPKNWGWWQVGSARKSYLSRLLDLFISHAHVVHLNTNNVKESIKIFIPYHLHRPHLCRVRIQDNLSSLLAPSHAVLVLRK